MQIDNLFPKKAIENFLFNWSQKTKKRSFLITSQESLKELHIYQFSSWFKMQHLLYSRTPRSVDISNKRINLFYLYFLIHYFFLKIIQIPVFLLLFPQRIPP